MYSNPILSKFTLQYLIVNDPLGNQIGTHKIKYFSVNWYITLNTNYPSLDMCINLNKRKGDRWHVLYDSFVA